MFVKKILLYLRNKLFLNAIRRIVSEESERVARIVSEESERVTRVVSEESERVARGCDFFVSRLKDDSQVFYYQINNRIKENELKAKVKAGKKIKVFFLFAQPSKFGMKTIYEEMLKSEMFDPYIYSVYYDKNDSLDINYAKPVCLEL